MTIPTGAGGTLRALGRGDLAGAREVRLPGLSELPRELFALSETLELLDLSGGTLASLPDDFGRLTKLRVLFCSGNRFERLPPVLGICASLSQVGFRATGLREIPGEALPPRLRWLTVTDNRLEHLPRELGERPQLQKLMLSGNGLRALPEGLAAAPKLELIRIAANALEAVPSWLADLPRLAWVSWAGNPGEAALERAPARLIPLHDLTVGELLGEGASGRVHRALWRQQDGATEPVALKLFKGGMTSDGLPEREMAACLAAGAHPALAGALGCLCEHPEGAQGLIMPLVPPHWRVLAGPPSLRSCSRDVYDPDLTLAPAAALRIARAAATAAAYLHKRGLLHGDLYGHNILWDGSSGEAVLSDFGAASVLPPGPEGQGFQRVEVNAWGILLGELLAHCPGLADAAGELAELQRACTDPDSRQRPTMAEALARLDRPTES